MHHHLSRFSVPPSPSHPSPLPPSLLLPITQWRTNLLWDHIVNFQPQAYLWLGDAVYVKEKEGDNEANLRKAYARQLKNEGYQRLLSTGAVIEGVYDDHDMSTNDGHRVVRLCVGWRVCAYCTFPPLYFTTKHFFFVSSLPIPSPSSPSIKQTELHPPTSSSLPRLPRPHSPLLPPPLPARPLLLPPLRHRPATSQNHFYRRPFLERWPCFEPA